MDTQEILSRLKKHIEILHDVILNERTDKDGNFELVIQRGSYVVIIRYFISNPYIEVTFPFPPNEDNTLQIFDELVKDPKVIFGLREVLTSPISAFNLHYEDERFRGFSVMTRVFLTRQNNFSIKELDGAIKAVVSAGSLGYVFIHYTIGDKESEQKIIGAIFQSSPGDMFM
jgi:hypothetical protein